MAVRRSPVGQVESARTANPVFVALDTTDLDYARGLAERVRAHVGGLKLGLEFFTAHGPEGVRAFAGMGLPVFLDLKFHDIPNTVAGACARRRRWASTSSMSMPQGGAAMMKAAVEAARSVNPHDQGDRGDGADQPFR